MSRKDEFDWLYERHLERVYRFCCRLCGNATDAEDLTQDVFIRAFRSLEAFEGRSSHATWLCRIALRRWQDLRRLRHVETIPLSDELDASPSRDPGDAIIERLSLDRALAALPDPLREALLLVTVADLKYREAAEVLGIPQGTVHSRVQEALRRVRATLAAEEGEPGCSTGRRTREGGQK